MENAVEALEMAFAMLIFLLALALALFLFGKVKGLSDFVDRNKDIKYLEHVSKMDLNSEEYVTTGRTRVARRVKVKDILPALYSYSTETQSIMIDFEPNKSGDRPEDGKFVFGIGSLGAFNRRLGAGGTLTYDMYDWGAVQQAAYGGLVGAVTLKDYIDAFVSGETISGVKKQTITETIVDGQVIRPNITVSIDMNTTLAFGSSYYLMDPKYQDKYFIETYEKFEVFNNIKNSNGDFLKYRSDDDEGEEKEYIYITYTLIP